MIRHKLPVYSVFSSTTIYSTIGTKEVIDNQPRELVSNTLLKAVTDLNILPPFFCPSFS